MVFSVKFFAALALAFMVFTTATPFISTSTQLNSTSTQHNSTSTQHNSTSTQHNSTSTQHNTTPTPQHTNTVTVTSDLISSSIETVQLNVTLTAPTVTVSTTGTQSVTTTVQYVPSAAILGNVQVYPYGGCVGSPQLSGAQNQTIDFDYVSSSGACTAAIIPFWSIAIYQPEPQASQISCSLYVDTSCATPEENQQASWERNRYGCTNMKKTAQSFNCTIYDPND
jgi:hypothetical protein